MRTSRSSREALLVLVALAALSGCGRASPEQEPAAAQESVSSAPQAAAEACSTFEASKSVQGTTATFRDDRFPWLVTADLDGTVTIRNTAKNTSCSATVESVVTVYMGTGNQIYFRSLEIASDNAFPIDGLSCADAGEPVRLDPTSAEKSRTALRAAGICPIH